MLEIVTLGGGQHIVNVLNAVAAWCGGGGFRSMLQVVMVMGLAYALLIMALALNWKAAFHWFITATAMYMCLIVPTTNVVVIDRVNPVAGNGSVSNVPIGLAAMASFSSQVSDWLTRTAEAVFVEPGALTLSQYGMLYPTRVNELSRQFVIANPILKQNVEAYITQCYLYGVMIHSSAATSLQQLSTSPDLLTALGPGSSARMVAFVSEGGSEVILCSDAYARIKAAYGALATQSFAQIAPSFYPYLPTAQAVSKLQADLPQVTLGLYGTAMSAQQVFQQRSLVDAFMEARANLGSGDGDTFATMHAQLQAQNVMIASARQAMTWVPVLNLVLTIVFYAMFPVIFPLFLLPQSGIPALKAYLAGFFYLSSWGPLSAVLHMFVTAEAAAQLTAAASGSGMTMAAMPMIDAINQNSAVMAGFLLMSVPVLAGGMARGAMSLAGNAGAMLTPVQHGADAAAVERTTGNYSYGNATANQWNTAATHRDGAGVSTFVAANGTEVARSSDGALIYNNAPGISRLGFTPSEVEGAMRNVSDSAARYHNQATSYRQAASETYSAGLSRVHGLTRGFGTHDGGDTTSGTRTSGQHQASQMDSLQSGDTVNSGYDVSQRAGVSRTASDRTAKSVSSTGMGSLGIAGGRGGSPAGASLTASVGTDRNWARTDQRDQVAQTSSRSGESTADTVYSANGEAVTFSHEGFTSKGRYYRYDAFGETRDALERRFSEAQSLEKQAASSEEQGNRLDHVVSDAQHRGWQLSDDMSQVVASRYNAMANSRYAGLGAPSLNQVDLTARQRELRNTIVADVLQEYSGMAGMALLQKSGDMGGFVAPLQSFSEVDLRESVPARSMGPMKPQGRTGQPTEVAQAKIGVSEGKSKLAEHHRNARENLRQANHLVNEEVKPR